MTDPLPARPASSIPEIVQRYIHGESIRSIAEDTNHCFRTIYKWLLKETGAEYESIQTDALISRVADADYELSIARDKVSVARAREQGRFARMDLERRRPKLYGPKQEIEMDSKHTIIIQAPPPRVTQYIDVQPAVEQRQTQVIDNTNDGNTSNV